jgi:hypothetical protein
MVWYVLFLELFYWYGMFCLGSCSHGVLCFVFWNCSHGMVSFIFGAVLMVWYVLFLEKTKHTIPREQLQK